MELVAFHGKQETKDFYVSRVREHIRLDHLTRGVGYENKNGVIKACAVGCSLNSYNHAAYETELGIPEWLARVEDTLFEGMSQKKSQTWPEKFLLAIKPGADLEKVKTPFLCVILKHTLKSMAATKYDKKKWPEVTAAIKQSKTAVEGMIKALKSGDKVAIAAAQTAAYSAADSAADSARSAAYSAADSAADSARSAADSARSAAYSAAYSAADSAAYSAAYDYYADELLKLLKKAK